MRVKEIGCISSTNVCSFCYGNLQLPNELPTTHTHRVKENKIGLLSAGATLVTRPKKGWQGGQYMEGLFI